MRRAIALVAAVALAVAACGSGEEPEATAPPEADRSPAYVNEVEIVLLDSHPVQVQAIIRGDLPTPCHQLDWEIAEPDNGRIEVDVYSTVDPEAVCAQVLEPFEDTIDVGSFESGDYVLVIDGEEHPFTI
jgi:hypothetical protein